MKIIEAIRAEREIQVAFVGAGGKTTAMFHLARQFAARDPEQPVFVTASTHMGVDQVVLADRHRVLLPDQDPFRLLDDARTQGGMTIFTGPVEGIKTTGVAEEMLSILSDYARENHIPVLIEADGSRQLPLKAPAQHEPAIPGWVTDVVVVAGLSGLGMPLDSEHIHRPDLFSRLSGISKDDPVSIEGVIRVLSHSEGGLKNIPPGARPYLLLNQADSPKLIEAAEQIAQGVREFYRSILIGQLASGEDGIIEPYHPSAAIVLAAGGATRYGEPKILLDYHGRPFLRQIAETVLQAGLDPVIVVLSKANEKARESLNGLPVQVVINRNSGQGKSTSIIAGLRSLPQDCRSVLFLLGDMPQITVDLIQELLRTHWKTNAAITIPTFKGKRANPVLFDRTTFGDLLDLRGDEGGKKLYGKFTPIELEWDDERILLDVDTPDDYRRLIQITKEREK